MRKTKLQAIEVCYRDTDGVSKRCVCTDLDRVAKGPPPHSLRDAMNGFIELRQTKGDPILIEPKDFVWARLLP